MSTNGYTREFILDRASELASQVGLTGLSIGAVARCIARSKSTVFFHFCSKERLQLGVLESAARKLAREVIRPAFLLPDGLPRGCLFVATASEFDDRRGPVREGLVRLYLLWRHLVGSLVGAAVTGGTFRPDTDRDQFLHNLHGIMLAYHHSSRLLHDPDAERRARLALRGW